MTIGARFAKWGLGLFIFGGRIEHLKALGAGQLLNLPEEITDIESCCVERVTVTTFHELIEHDWHLIVVQAFRETLRWPKYISFRGIGQLAPKSSGLSRAPA